MNILAIETSCDETAAAVVKSSGLRNQGLEIRTNILSSIISSQIDIHRKFGGVFPEHASRAHTEKIIPVIKEALNNAKTTLDKIDLIAVTNGPGLIGSLLIGVNTAKALAFANNKPIIGINHWLGHIYSNFVRVELKTKNAKVKTTANNSKLPEFPALILIVSGGHTGLVLMKSHTDIKTIGQTLDDAAGEAFDKVAKLLQLGYPGGPAIAKAAAKIKNQKSKIQINIKFPRSMLNSGDYNFSFSGLKTSVLYKVKELIKSYKLDAISHRIAYEFQQAVIDILVGKTIQAAHKFKPKSVCICGGVSANVFLRQHLNKAVKKLPTKTSYHTPPIELTTDNAAMIGIAAAYKDKSKYTAWNKISANANLKL